MGHFWESVYMLFVLLLVLKKLLLQEQLVRKPASAPERLLRGRYHTDGPNIPATKTVIGSLICDATVFHFTFKWTIFS